MKMFFIAATLLGLSIGIGAYVNQKDFPQDCTVEMSVIVSTSRDTGFTYSTSRQVGKGESLQKALKELGDICAGLIGGKP